MDWKFDRMGRIIIIMKIVKGKKICYLCLMKVNEQGRPFNKQGWPFNEQGQPFNEHYMYSCMGNSLVIACQVAPNISHCYGWVTKQLKAFIPTIV